ncbi:vacuolar protein sorting-associated protein 16 homolog [Lineus longissimus]|uniref:vacuolar protein sorting-associated protein 16 homolog n=1 Tax=Lineus longissimus TaxID=88925 RepID=UPI002B4CDF6D
MAFMTANWNSLGDVFFRRFELYSFFDTSWFSDVDLAKFNISAAPYGGPIALVRDDRRTASATAKPIIYIYSSAGRLLSQIRWSSGRILDIGWSETEDLLCVQDDGSVLVYDIFGNFSKTFGMGNDAKETKCLECRIFRSYNGTGIAVLTGTYRIFVINSVQDPRIRRLTDVPGLNKPPSSWLMMTLDRNSKALVAVESRLYYLDHGGQYEEQHPEFKSPINSIIEMAASYNNKYIALFSDTGILWIGSSDLKTCYCEHDTKFQSRPRQLAWCGTGAVLGYWNDLLLMVGPKGVPISYNADGPSHLVPEMDGLRIVSNTSHEMLQKVPSVIEDIFKIGSMTPGAMLFEASREFQRGSQRADEYIRTIKDKLDLAVEQCIEAAGQEYDPKVQKKLLKAASFGKCFLTDMRPDAFVNMCQMLRVLNAVRDYSATGIPLTYNQLQHLSIQILIDRLVHRREYCLAIRICEYLKIPEAEGASRILAHWACYKVQQSDVDDEIVARAIAQKLGETPGVSYSEIANKAIEKGRKDLAIRLLDFEPKAAEQVPLLMKMNSKEHALNKAIESGDTDLIYTVVLHLKESMPLGDFFMTIRTMPTAYSLYLQYCRQQNLKTLQDLYYQEDNYEEEAHCRVIESYTEERFDARISGLIGAQESYSKAKNDWSAKVTEEQVKLLRYQRRLEEELNRPYLDLSVHETIYKVLKENNHKMADTLKKEFKIPDRRFWWLKIQALAEAGDWIELERFSKSKKSPIGYEPFVEVSMKHLNRQEATKYLPKVVAEQMVKCLVLVGQIEQAAEFAFQQRNDEDLAYVLKKCNSNQKGLAEKVLGFRQQLSQRR